ncbi:MAG TPA: trypsin-like serine protease [Candidatus Marinimicrobia bacterium]|jgi:serine protease Do|nr:trypsin-like peptidase domain-containing protein [Candidatus Neomarinimicrobiota bacterium]HIB13994.1 trypsin-like serine protease [Candidatus Neomarinimicrobiota bacterium]HIM53823.1 trypsin-like serine protease [Candidatus Neomarinimicrobiota bacterium]HIO40271.1 trypsin-like serine protease [Candidatus Neomarinimicrobiota bacterium]
MNRFYPSLFVAIFLLSCQLETPPFAQQEGIDKSRQTAITYAIEQISNSVVGINVTQLKQQQVNPFFDPFWGGFFPYTRTFKVDNMGSGVLVSPDGYIITNTHVVDNATEIVVTLRGGKSYEAQLVGMDNLTDIALVKVDDSDLPFANLGNSDELIVGEWAIALGNPLGLFDVNHQPTATAGIISGVKMDFGLKESGHVYQNMIQTDAAINPGNSGGPLVNALGEVIGINTFIMTGSNYSSGSIGIGFAIPINRVKEVAEDLKKFGKVERSYTTGVHVQAIDPVMQRYLRLPTSEGVIITDVEKRSSGERAGLQIGDVILAVDNRKINSPKDIIRVIDEGLHKVGDNVTLTILRESNSIDIQLTLEEPKSKWWGF